ncbi:MAG: 30S ribosomal protein S14 [Cytophagales bacterium]
MAKQSKIKREEKLQEFYEKYALKWKELKKKKDRLGQDKMKKMSIKYRQRNRCAVTGKARGFVGKTATNQKTFIELASQGYVPGARKSSW